MLPSPKYFIATALLGIVKMLGAGLQTLPRLGAGFETTCS